MNNRIKKQHIVPRILQKQFASENGSIWYSERGHDNSYEAPYLKRIETAFVIKNYYTVGSGSELSDVVERKFYGNIDDYLGRILPKVISSFAQNIVPLFEGEALIGLRLVVFEMLKRTPDFIKSNDDSAIGKSILDATIRSLNENADHAGIVRLDTEMKKNPNFMREIGRNTRVRATIKRSKKMETTLEDFSVRWAFCESKHSFLLTSMMVYRVGNGGSNGLSNPNVEIWMPLSPKIALVLLRDKHNKIPLKIDETRNHIRAVNEFAANNSRQIASHSKELIESITGKKARTSLSG
jgi:Protein of unknown function (DUF4238)